MTSQIRAASAADYAMDMSIGVKVKSGRIAPQLSCDRLDQSAR